MKRTIKLEDGTEVNISQESYDELKKAVQDNKWEYLKFDNLKWVEVENVWLPNDTTNRESHWSPVNSIEIEPCEGSWGENGADKYVYYCKINNSFGEETTFLTIFRKKVN